MGQAENIAVVRRMFDDWNARRPVSPELLDPEVPWDVRNHPVPEIRRVDHGRDEVRRFWIDWLLPWEEITAEVHWVKAAGDRVVAWLTRRMVARETGLEFHYDYAWEVILREGQYTRVAFFADEAEALAAVGEAP